MTLPDTELSKRSKDQTTQTTDDGAADLTDQQKTPCPVCGKNTKNEFCTLDCAKQWVAELRELEKELDS